MDHACILNQFNTRSTSKIGFANFRRPYPGRAQECTCCCYIIFWTSSGPSTPPRLHVASWYVSVHLVGGVEGYGEKVGVSKCVPLPSSRKHTGNVCSSNLTFVSSFTHSKSRTGRDPSLPCRLQLTFPYSASPASPHFRNTCLYCFHADLEGTAVWTCDQQHYFVGSICACCW